MNLFEEFSPLCASLELRRPDNFNPLDVPLMCGVSYQIVVNRLKSFLKEPFYFKKFIFGLFPRDISITFMILNY